MLVIAQKTRFKVDPTFGAFTGAIVEVRTREGKSHSLDLNNTSRKKTSLGVEELVVKFKDCASYSRKLLSSASIDKLITTILHLENVRDIREITWILAA